MIAILHRTYAALDRAAAPVLATAARFTFAAVLAHYYWASALTKLDGPFSPALGGYAQIFPRQMEAAGYDVSQLSAFHTLVVLAGSWAEIVLPALLILGLLTRPAALGMAGFIIVQSLTDVIGHGADAETIGAWFDRASDAVILDQRAFWMLGLLILLMHGAGPLSLDRLFARRAQPRPGSNHG